MVSTDQASVARFQAFLRRNGVMFACAESCTGGLLAREMTARAGSSEVFWGGVVSYSNDAKIAILGVSQAQLEAHGAVSGPVAAAMVQGILAPSQSSLAVSVTGIAGPTGGSREKPVGTVWFGLATQRSGLGTVGAVCLHFEGSRSRVQRQASRMARVLARLWWESGNDLDSLLSLADNEGKPVVLAFQPPFSFPSNPL